MAKQNTMDTAEYENYIFRFHRSLTKPLYWMGVPRNLLLSEMLFGILGGIIFKTFLVPVMAVIVHLLFRFLGRKDSQFHLVFWRSKDYKPYYHV